MTTLGRTRAGHLPEEIEGDAAQVRARGSEMMSLGAAMQSAADSLKQYEEGATGERGRSVEAIKEKVGNSYEDLEHAASRYSTTGDIMVDYGRDLSLANREILRVLPDLDELWLAYQQALTSADGAEDAHANAPADDPEHPPAPGQSQGDLLAALRAANGAADDAKEAYLLRSEAYDTAWSDWSGAYDRAKGRLESAIDDELEDGWKDKLLDVLEVVVDVLTIVGMVLVVAALIIGGPIVGAIAAVVAVATLIGTVVLYANDRATGKDVGFAVVGVIPFGKVASVMRGGKFLDPGTVQTFKQGFSGGVLNGTRTAGSIPDLLTGSIQGIKSVAQSTGRTPVLRNFLGFDPDGPIDAFQVMMSHGGDVIGRNVIVPSYSGNSLAQDGFGAR